MLCKPLVGEWVFPCTAVPVNEIIMYMRTYKLTTVQDGNGFVGTVLTYLSSFPCRVTWTENFLKKM